MGRFPGERLTPEVAREVCQRMGSKAMLAGSIAGLGSQYVVGLKAVNCNSGDVLAEVQEQAANKEAVLKALDSVAASLRGKLGESLSSVQKYATPVERDYPSLEALQAYSLACKDIVGKTTIPAPYAPLQRAVRLDPNFAMAMPAWDCVSQSRGNGLATDNTGGLTSYASGSMNARGWRSRPLLSDCHRRPRKGAPVLRTLGTDLSAVTSSRRRTFVAIYTILGQYDRALAEAREALRLEPASGNNYENLAFSYFFLDQMEEAQATIAEAHAKKLDTPYLHFLVYLLAFVENDTAGMAQQVAWSAAIRESKMCSSMRKPIRPPIPGSSTKARELSRRAVASAQRAQQKETAADTKPQQLFGKRSSAIRPRPGSGPLRRSSSPPAGMCSTQRRWRWR